MIKLVKLDRHHRKARSNKGKNEPRNISIVPRYMHIAFHQMFGVMQPDDIATQLTKILDSLNETWVDSDFKLIYKIIAVKREKWKKRSAWYVK